MLPDSPNEFQFSLKLAKFKWDGASWWGRAGLPALFASQTGEVFFIAGQNMGLSSLQSKEKQKSEEYKFIMTDSSEIFVQKRWNLITYLPCDIHIGFVYLILGQWLIKISQKASKFSLK